LALTKQEGESVSKAVRVEARLAGGGQVEPLKPSACWKHLQAEGLLKPHAGNWSKKEVVGEEGMDTGGDEKRRRGNKEGDGRERGQEGRRK
jgi:hypothetical protein